jgi:hypothetical protein
MCIIVHKSQYGPIGGEVGKVYPELVINDDAGQIQGVRCEESAPVPLNEVQQRKMAEKDQRYIAPEDR